MKDFDHKYQMSISSDKNSTGAQIAKNRPSAARSRLFDAIVIGGGLSGLSVSRRLKAAGASVVLLEARSRIGGRVHSQRLDIGHTIDLGAGFQRGQHF
jgi:monoamine oxidase